MDKIFIKDLEVFANHGVYPEEQALGQKFVVSVCMETDAREAGQTDDLTKSIHYGDAAVFITEYLQSHTFRLIESAAEQLAQAMLTGIDGLQAVTVRLCKPWAPVKLPVDTVGVEIRRAWHTAYIALGANMGEEKAFLDGAVRALDDAEDCRVTKVADYITTKPYGGVEQDDYLNSALELRTLLTPRELLQRLHEIEAAAGRERKVRWGPRTLDLDILLYDDLVIDSPDLTVPHKEMHLRGFVLEPMAQIAPYKRHPLLLKTVEQLWRELE